MDRRSIIVASVLAAVLAVTVGVGIALNSGGGSQSVRAPGVSTTTTAALPTSAPATTTSTRVAQSTPTVPTTPKPTVVIQPPAPTTTTARTTRPTAPPTTTTARTTGPTAPPTTSTTAPSGASDIGVTPTEIRVTVVADIPAVASGTQAWAAALNQAGGLAGRAVRVDVRLVASTGDYAAAVAQACTTSFAVVGSSSRFDQAGGGLACGIPELATRIFDPAHRALPNTYSVLPARAGVERVGAFKQLLATVPGCCRQYVLVPTDQPDRATTQTSLRAAGLVGFTTAGTPDVAPDAPPSEYARLVGELVAGHATLARSGLGVASTVLLRQAAATNPGARAVKTWYCDAACDDPTFLASGGAAVDRQLVDIESNPLSDQRQVPAIAAYIRAVRKVGGPPSLSGVQSYSAGLLFDRAVREVIAANGRNGLTRVRLLAAVSGVRDFSANGILGITDVGGRQPNGCYALLRVQHGHFTRNHPTAPTQLDCGAQNLLTLSSGG